MDGSREYDLCIRQQPKQARMCGVGADRRPIDPPPIVQLRVIDKARKNLPSPSPSPPPPTQHHQQPQHAQQQHSSHESSGPLDTSMLTPAGFGAGPFLQNPYYFMFASLAKPDDDTELHWMKDGKTRCTTGSVVSSLYHLKDSENDNRDAGFFVFPDLSVRQEGSYRLKLSLFEVVGSNVYHCKSIFSTPFYVYTAKKFPGMEESTPLSCSLADQGIKIRIRKDIRQRKPRSSTTNFPITNGQPLGPGVPITEDESDRESEVRHEDHNDTTNNHNSLSNITASKPLNGRKRPEREPEKDRERDSKRPRVDGDEGEPAPNPPPSTGEWGMDTPLAPGAPSAPYDHHTRSTASVPPPPPSAAPGYPPPPPPQHPTYDQPPPQHHAPVPAHHPPQHQPPHHYPAPPPQSVHPQHHPQHPPPPPYPAQYPSSWPPPQHPQHPPPPPHQYDHYQQHYTQYPPPRYASAPYDPYAPPPPQPQSVPAYPSAAGYYAQYGRPGEPYGQYPQPAPPAPPPGPEGPNSSNRNPPPVYGQYQPPPPQQPPPPPAQQPPTTTENNNYPPPTPSASSSTGGRTSTGPAPPAPPPGAGAASVYYQSHAQAAPRGYGTPPPTAYPPAPYHAHPPPPPPTHHASPPGHYPPYQHPSHPPPPPQGTWSAPSYPAPAPGVYPGQSQNQNGTWENGAASAGHGNVPATTRETSAAPPPAATTQPSTSGGPGLQLPPLRGPDSSHGDRQPDARADLKDDRERRKEEREPWSMRGHGLGGGAPPTSALGGMNRPDRSRKRLGIETLLTEGQ